MYQPHIDTLMQEKKLVAIDIIAAEGVIYPDRDAVFMALLYLSSAFRQGYLYVDIYPQLYPSIENIWGHEHQSLQDTIIAGFKEVVHESLIVKQGSQIFFERAFADLEGVKRELHRLLQHPIHISNNEKMRLLLLQAKSDQLLTQEQHLALSFLMDKSVGGIIGGPGTGKTHTAGLFLKAYLGMFQEVERERKRIVLTGPTGKAVQNLKKSIERAYGTSFSSVEELIEVKTLHALLKLSSFHTDDREMRPLPYHLIIVDESSMIDVSLMRKLLTKVKGGTQLLFLGDPNQLPPVEPGAIFSELVEKKMLPIAQLETCLRCELQPIIEFAHAIQQSDREKIEESLEGVSSSPVSFHSLEVGNFALERYIPCFKELTSGRLEDLDEFRLLCPLNEGSFSVSSINEKLYHACLQLCVEYLPIIITKNDYELNLMNGQMGILLPQKNIARFMVERETIEIPTTLLPRYDLAFCLSVHKSQGSEFNHVVLLLPQGAECFGKKMLYTAVTRAKSKIEIFGQTTTFAQTLT